MNPCVTSPVDVIIVTYLSPKGSLVHSAVSSEIGVVLIPSLPTCICITVFARKERLRSKNQFSHIQNDDHIDAYFKTVLARDCFDVGRLYLPAIGWEHLSIGFKLGISLLLTSPSAGFKDSPLLLNSDLREYAPWTVSPSSSHSLFSSWRKEVSKYYAVRAFGFRDPIADA